MPRMVDRLSARAVATLTIPGMYADGHGLYLRIAPGGSKQWIFRYRANGRLRNMGLGPLHTLTLAEARERAKACRVQRLDGIDPLDARREQRQKVQIEAAKAMTFAECAEQYAKAHQAGWRGKRTAHDWRMSLSRYAFPVFGELPVAAVDTALVVKAVEPIWTSKTTTASLLRNRIEAVLSWATTAGYRSGENPARWKGHLANLLPRPGRVSQVEHRGALPYADLPAFMAELRESIADRAVGFLILTAARVGEVRGARWSEIDLDARTWTIPAERMKSSREHKVPLSEAAMAILRSFSRQGGLVFPGGRAGQPLSQRTFLNIVTRLGYSGVTVHGFRSTFRDWCAERTNFPREVAEMALAHSVGNAVEQAYRRGDMFDKRRQLAEAWARYCYSPAGAGAEVVAIRG